MSDLGGQVVTGHLGTVEGFNAMAMQDEASGAIEVLLTSASEVDFLTPSLKALKVAGRHQAPGSAPAPDADSSTCPWWARARPCIVAGPTRSSS